MIPVYAPFVFAKGYTFLAYVTAFGLGPILLGFCFIGRRELKELWTKTAKHSICDADLSPDEDSYNIRSG